MPAIDLREGCCVQLRGGAFDRELLRIEDPLDVARSWRSRGATALHVVDLDAATGRGANTEVLEAICQVEGIDVHVGGGVRDDAAVARLLAAGARSALVGTRAIEDRAWLGGVATAHPGRVSLAVDVRGGKVTTHGWAATTGRDPVEVLHAARDLDLCQVVVTAVDVEGAADGPDLHLAESARRATGHRLGYAGGVASASDLATLRDLGMDAVVVGTALYTGALGSEGLFEERSA